MIVPRWPFAVPAAPRTVPGLSARSLPLIDSPGALIPGSVSLVRPSGHVADRTPVVVEAPALAAVAATEVSRPAAFVPVVATPGAGAESAPETALLASRRVDLAGVLDPQTDDDDLLASASPSSYAFVEIPAVVVSRAVMVAGRGIRTGLRATGAVFRAAF